MKLNEQQDRTLRHYRSKNGAKTLEECVAVALEQRRILGGIARGNRDRIQPEITEAIYSGYAELLHLERRENNVGCALIAHMERVHSKTVQYEVEELQKFGTECGYTLLRHLTDVRKYYLYPGPQHNVVKLARWLATTRYPHSYVCKELILADVSLLSEEYRDQPIPAT